MNKPIETVSIVGAGAVGAAYASILHEMDCRCVSLVAGGDRGKRLRKEGLMVNGRHYLIPVLLPEDLSEPSDLVMVAVKHHHLGEAIRDVKNRVGAKTAIMSVMNGIESEERIGAVYGMQKVLYAVTMGIDALREENRITYTTQGKLFFGEARNAVPAERVARVQALFDKAGIIYETPPDMIRILWWKFMVNVGINQTSVLLRAPYSVFQTSQEARNLMESAMREVLMLSEKAGVNLSEEDIGKFGIVLQSLSPQGKTSMLQDIEARRKTEVEMFAGKVVELGKRLDVPTPINQQLFDSITKMEAEYSSSPSLKPLS